MKKRQKYLRSYTDLRDTHPQSSSYNPSDQCCLNEREQKIVEVMENCAIEAVRLNNKAIDMMLLTSRAQDDDGEERGRSSPIRHHADGNIEDSTHMLVAALRQVKLLLATSEGGSRSKAKHRTNAIALATPIDTTWVRRARCHSMDSAGSMFQNGDGQYGDYIFDRFFYIHPNAYIKGAAGSPTATQILISCVLFNIALIHHYRAMSFGPCVERRILLKKSAAFYHSSCKLSTAAYDDRPTDIKIWEHDIVCVALKVGALNNSAQILYESAQYEEATKRLQLIERIFSDTERLLPPVDVGCKRERKSKRPLCLTVTDYEGILANCLLLKPPTVAVAA